MSFSVCKKEMVLVYVYVTEFSVTEGNIGRVKACKDETVNIQLTYLP